MSWFAVCSKCDIEDCHPISVPEYIFDQYAEHSNMLCETHDTYICMNTCVKCERNYYAYQDHMEYCPRCILNRESPKRFVIQGRVFEFCS